MHHPENARIIEKIIGRSGNTVDTHLAPAFAAARRAGSDFRVAINHAVECGVDRKTAFGIGTRHIVIGGATQAPPRRQEGNGFDEIGFAGAVFARQHHMARSQRQRQFCIVAEIDKLKPPDRNAIRAAFYVIFCFHNRVLCGAFPARRRRLSRFW